MNHVNQPGAVAPVRLRGDAFDPELGRLLEQITARLIDGEILDLETLAQEHRHHAEALREMVPAMAAVAQLGRPEDDAAEALGQAPPRELGDFRIIREIGRGGMGIVYEVEQLSLGRRVALKVLPLAGMLDERQLQRFKNEARAAATLQHTNIVPVYAVGSDRGVHFYAMQLIAGRSMAEVLDELRRAEGIEAPTSRLAVAGTATEECGVSECRMGNDSVANGFRAVSATLTNHHRPPTTPLDTIAAALLTHVATSPSSQFAGGIRKSKYIRSVVNLAIQAANALDHAHTEGIVHRDIKPANLLLDGAGRLWVTDFGLARIQADVGMTVTCDLLGTLRYMSPEQALAQRIVIDHRTDIYSLGVTLYELLTLRPIFDGTDRQDLLRQIAFDEPLPPRKLNHAIPHDLETITIKATAKNPDERYSTVREFADDLEHLVRIEPIRARRATALQKIARWSRRHRTVVAGLAIILLVTAALASAAAVLLAIERNRTIAAQSQAEENLAIAREAVEDMYVQVAEKWLADEPQMETVQREFLLKAVTYFERFVEQEGESPATQLQVATALRRVGNVHFRFGDYPKAVTVLESSIRRLKSYNGLQLTIEARVELARAHQILGDVLWTWNRFDARANVNSAIELWRALIKERPHEFRYKAALAQCLAECAHHSGEEPLFTEAQELATELVKGAPDDPEYWYPLGLAQCWAGNTRTNGGRHREGVDLLEQAATSLSKSLQLNLRNSKAREALSIVKQSQARSLKGLGKDSEAIDVLEEAIAIGRNLVDEFPNVPAFQMTLGAAFGDRACLDLKDVTVAHRHFRLAVNHYEAACKVNIHDHNAARFLAHQYNNWMVTSAEMGLDNETHEAQSKLATHLLAILERPGPFRTKGFAYGIAPQLEGTAASLARERSPEFQRPSLALQLAKKAYEIDEQNPGHWGALGMAHYRAGHHREAIEWLTRANNSWSEPQVIPLFFLAMAQWQVGALEQSRESFDRAAGCMHEKFPADKNMARVRAEVAELLGIREATDSTARAKTVKH